MKFFVLFSVLFSTVSFANEQVSPLWFERYFLETVDQCDTKDTKKLKEIVEKLEIDHSFFALAQTFAEKLVRKTMVGPLVKPDNYRDFCKQIPEYDRLIGTDEQGESELSRIVNKCGSKDCSDIGTEVMIDLLVPLEKLIAVCAFPDDENTDKVAQLEKIKDSLLTLSIQNMLLHASSKVGKEGLEICKLSSTLKEEN